MAFLALFMLLVPQGPERGQAFVELSARPSTAFVEQPITLTIRFGVEREFLRHNLLQLFTRPLDVPVQLELAPEFALAGAPAADSPLQRPSFALGEEIVRAARSHEEQRAGATWLVLELERAYVPLAPGRVELASPVLHFAYATRFQEDGVAGTVALDRQSGVAQGAPLVLEIAPLPEQGRPPGFVDAVGKFTLLARAEPRELEAGGTLRLVLEIAGEGNLGRLAPPRLDALAGWHLQGRTDELHGGTRTLVCDLVPDSPRTREVPAIALEYFDPDARAYGRASTQPIAIAVQARAPAGADESKSFPGGLVLFAVIAAAVIAFLVWRRRA